MQSASPVVSIRNLDVRFTRADGSVVKALNQISLDIAAGEFVCILGRSGHGKTTLLNVVAGLLTMYEGELLVMDKPVTGPGTDRGVIFQRDAVYPWMRVEDNVAFGLMVRGVGKEERLRVARDQIAQVGLTPVARAWPRELSGGMRARVAIASVFANDRPSCWRTNRSVRWTM
jgi:NitT/TauT family transport system ATP-binding protein